ncbi:MAG: autotransporter outer membrane beta-barrel domain-containing protein [Formosimonas sp.]
MNKIHQIIWSKARQKWVVVAETCTKTSPQDSTVGSVSKGLNIKWALALVAALGAATPQWAMAACTLTSGTNYECTGATTSGQGFAGPNATITTQPGFSLTTSGIALNLTNSGGSGSVNYTDNNTSPIVSTGDRGVFGGVTGNLSIATTGSITAQTNGIEVYVVDGDLNIDAKGAIQGKNQYGVFADMNGGSAGATNISVADVTSAHSAIAVLHRGTDLTVRTTGDLTSGYDALAMTNSGTGNTLVEVQGSINANRNGIWIINGSSAGAIEVKTADITGNGEGIKLEQFGKGGVTVTSTGTVTGGATEQGMELLNSGAGAIVANANNVTGGNFGIIANNGSNNATGLSITANQVSSTKSGDAIYAYHRGTGNLSVTTKGDVIGIEDGMELRNEATGAIVVNANNVQGRQFGIYANNAATASGLSITANQVSSTNSGDAIYAEHRGTGDLSVTTKGDVIGIEDGMELRNGATGAIVVNANNVQGRQFGIYANNAATASGLSITANQVTASGSADAIYAEHRGTGDLAVTTTGAVSGARSGIVLSNASKGNTTVNAQNVEGKASYGVYVASVSGATTVKAADVTSVNEGVRVNHTGSGDVSITTTGKVASSQQEGLYVENAGQGNTNVVAQGDVTAGGNGIHIDSRNTTGGVAVSSGNVTAAYDGIYVAHAGKGDVAVSSTGNITATGQQGIEVYNTSAGGATTVNAANINSNEHAILVLHEGTGDVNVSASGNLTSSTQEGVWLRNFGSANAIVDVRGDIAAAGTGVYAETAGTSGDISVKVANVAADYDGVFVNQIGAGDAVVTATGSIAAANGKGILVNNSTVGGSTTVTATNIASNEHAISVLHEGTGDVGVTATGSLASTAQEGVWLRNFGQGKAAIDVQGDIAAGGSGIQFESTASSDSVDIRAANVNGQYDGIYAEHKGSGAVNVTSTGAVQGVTQHGIRALGFSAGTNVNVTAHDVSGALNGIEARNDGTGTTQVTVDGVVKGGTGAGITTHDTDTTVGNNRATVVLNSGANVSSTSGIAILNDEGDSSTTVNSGAIVQGEIRLNNGSDDLTLSGSDFSALTVVDGGDDASTADGWVDTLTFSGVGSTGNSVALSQLGGDSKKFVNWEAFKFVNSNVTLTGAKLNSVNACGGSTTLVDSTIGTGGILGCVSPDTLIVAGTTTVAGNIEGAGGDDVIEVKDTAVVTGEILGDAAGQDGSGATKPGNDTFKWSGGSITKFNGGDGSDQALVTAAGFNGTQTLNGGDDVSGADGYVDALTLKGYGNLATSSSSLINWERINLDQTTLSLNDNTLTVGSGNGMGLFLGNGSTLNAGQTMALNGDLNIDGTSKMLAFNAGKGVYTVNGHVNNAGLITNKDASVGDVININGNYTSAGGRLELDTTLGGTDAQTDRLNISGTASGSTQLLINPVGTTGANTAQLLVTSGAPAGGEFALAAPVLSGTQEFVLKPIGNNWYLTSQVGTPDNPVVPVNPVVPTQPLILEGGEILYRPAIAGYVAAQMANSEATNNIQLTTLHQRLGELRNGTVGKDQTWLRPFASMVDSKGKDRFEFKQNTFGMQLGRDLHFSSTKDSSQRAGVMAFASQSDADFKDRVRPLAGLSEDTGRMKSLAYGLGGYYTVMRANGGYLDATTQVSKVRNRFTDAYGVKATQNGTQFAASVEVGQPVLQFGQGWSVEPQAQLTYAHTHYNGFSDAYSDVSSMNNNQLRARAGVRVGSKPVVVEEKTGAQYYAIANVVHDFIKPKALDTGLEKLHGSFDRTLFELGAGLDAKVGLNTQVYGDVRYQRSFRGNKSGAQANVGIKIKF